MSASTVKYNNDDLKLDWKELSELFSKYPFSQKITGLMSVKAHYDNFFGLDNPGRKAFLQANNPGIQYANVIRDLETYRDAIQNQTQDPGSQDELQTLTDQPVTVGTDMPSFTSDTQIQQSISPGKPAVKIKKTPPANQSDFTRWLLHQNIPSPPDTIEEDAKPIEKQGKFSDPNQLRDEIVSEPLAALYTQQGLIKEAIEMYTKLSLKIPDKSAYFAEIIKKLKKSN